MTTTKSIITEIGIIEGRDAILLDGVLQCNAEVLLEGRINAALCSRPTNNARWVPYRISFIGVKAFDCREVEISDWRNPSSFCEIVDSEWLGRLGLRAPCRHYVFATYDYVYEVAAKEYRLSLASEAQR